MATDNRGVMVYLPPDVESALADYCAANKLFRKTKDGEPSPSLGTGIVQYLRSQLLGIAPSNISTPTIGRDEVLELIRESMSSDVLGERLTADDACALIEQAIGPVQSNLAELLLRVDRLESSLTSSKPKATKAATTTEPDSEILKLAKRLEADPNGLQRSVRVGIADGLGGKALCDFLFQHGHGANNGAKPFDNSVAGRLVKAIAYLDES
jgi:hypothetical protein